MVGLKNHSSSWIYWHGFEFSPLWGEGMGFVWKIVKRLAAILCEPRYQMWDIYILYVDCLDPEGHYINFSKGLFRFVSFTYLTYVRCTSTFSNIMLDCRELLIEKEFRLSYLLHQMEFTHNLIATLRGHFLFRVCSKVKMATCCPQGRGTRS